MYFTDLTNGFTNLKNIFCKRFDQLRHSMRVVASTLVTRLIQLTLYPSKAHVASSAPSMYPGLQSARAQPT